MFASHQFWCWRFCWNNLGFVLLWDFLKEGTHGVLLCHTGKEVLLCCFEKLQCLLLSLDIWQISQPLWCCWDNPCKFGLDTGIWEKKIPLLSYSCCILTNLNILHRPRRDGSNRRSSAIWALPGGWHWVPALQAEWLPLMRFTDHQLAPDSKKKELPRRQPVRQSENKSPSGRALVYNFCKYYTHTYIHSYTVSSPINTSYEFFSQSTDVSLTCLNQNLLTEILCVETLSLALLPLPLMSPKCWIQIWTQCDFKASHLSGTCPLNLLATAD